MRPLVLSAGLIAVPPLVFSLTVHRLVARQRRTDALLLALGSELRWRWSRRLGPALRRELAVVWTAYAYPAAEWCVPPLLRFIGVEVAYISLTRIRLADLRWLGVDLLGDLRLARPMAAAGFLLIATAVFAVSAGVLRRWQHPPPARPIGPRTVLVPLVLGGFCWNAPALLGLWIVIASALHAGHIALLVSGGGRWDGSAAPGLDRADGLRRLLDTAPPERLAASAPVIERQLAWLLAIQPARGLELFAMLLRLDPDRVGGRLRAAALRAQVRAAPGTIEGDWPTLERRFVDALQDQPDEVLGALLHALQLSPRASRSTWFRRRATRLLLAHLDTVVRLSYRPPGWSAVPAARHLRLLALVQAGAPPMTRGQSWCLLGDLAAADGDRLREATARYRKALRRACPPARDRLAHCLAAEARERLRHRRARSARRRLAAARALCDDPSYRLLEVVSWIVAPARTTSDPALLADLRSLRRDGVEATTIAFWTAALHLLRARPDEAAAALGEGEQRELDDAPTWEAADQVVVLRAALEGDEPVLTATARSLSTSERPWLRHGPVVPLPMLAAVARHDRDLLVDLSQASGDPAVLPAWARLIAAHGAMERTLRLVTERSPLEAKETLDFARCLLRRRLV